MFLIIFSNRMSSINKFKLFLILFVTSLIVRFYVQLITTNFFILFSGHIKFMRSQKGKPQLIFRDYIYNKKITYANGNSNWRCAEFIKYKCLSSCLTKNNKLVRYRFSHQHPAPTRKLIKKLFSYDINGIPLN